MNEWHTEGSSVPTFTEVKKLEECDVRVEFISEGTRVKSTQKLFFVDHGNVLLLK